MPHAIKLFLSYTDNKDQGQMREELHKVGNRKEHRGHNGQGKLPKN